MDAAMIFVIGASYASVAPLPAPVRAAPVAIPPKSMTRKSGRKGKRRG